MDSRQHPQYLVGVGRRTLLLLALGALVVGATPAPVAASDTLEFDVELARIDGHDAQLLFNLNTDNITHSSVTESWNSLYKQEPGTITGRFIADTVDGTFTGQIQEMWSCSNCRTHDGQKVWATNQLINITATSGGNLIPDGAEWKIDGLADIAYEVDIEADENPSDCGGTACYICANQVCEVAEQMSGTATVIGWIEGETLALSYTDRLLADTSQMDFTELRRTQFIMSRLALQITGTVAPSSEEPTETEEPAEATAPDEEPPLPDEEQVGPSSEEQPRADDATPDEPAGDSEPDNEQLVPEDDGLAINPVGDTDSNFATVILIALILGGLGILSWVVVKQLIRAWSPPKRSVPAPRSDDDHSPQGASRNLSDPSVKTYDVGGKQMTYETTVEQLPPTQPTHILRNPENPTQEITGSDEYGQYHHVEPGREVIVIRRAGDYWEVKPPEAGRFWVDKRCVELKPPPPNPR